MNSQERYNFLLNHLSSYGYNFNRNSIPIQCPCCISEGRSNRKTANIYISDPDHPHYHCHRCGDHGVLEKLLAFHVLGWASNLTTVVPKDVYKDMMKALGEDNIAESSYKAIPVPQTTEVPYIELDERDYAYNALLRRLKLEETHRANLLSRGFTEEAIIENGYKSVPLVCRSGLATALRSEDAAALQGVPGFFYNKQEVWDIAKVPSGFFIPVRALSDDYSETRFGKIQGFQIRMDDPSSKQRYMWFTSANYNKGCAATTWSHFVGYPERTIWLTEGPLKADLLHYFTGDGVIAVPGVGALTHLKPMLEELKTKYGVSHIKIAFDMDYLTNENVKKSEAKLQDLLSEIGYTYVRETWNPEYKGIDDYLLATSKS